MANDVQSLDEIDQAILEALAGNARISLKELAQQVGLSSPSAAERLRSSDGAVRLSALMTWRGLLRLGFYQQVMRVTIPI